MSGEPPYTGNPALFDTSVGARFILLEPRAHVNIHLPQHAFSNIDKPVPASPP